MLSNISKQNIFRNYKFHTVRLSVFCLWKLIIDRCVIHIWQTHLLLQWLVLVYHDTDGMLASVTLICRLMKWKELLHGSWCFWCVTTTKVYTIGQSWRHCVTNVPKIYVIQTWYSNTQYCTLYVQNVIIQNTGHKLSSVLLTRQH